MRKEEKGITLVALVITIIILLILAAISIASLRDSGLFGAAKNAVNETNNATLKENKTLNEYENYVVNYTPKANS